MSDEEFVPLAVRRISRKGGSLSLTIPIEIVNMLDLKPNDNLVFLYNKNKKRIVIDKAVSTFTTPSGLSFSISKELAKKLLEGTKDEK